jgi:nucleotide-binding universal stress UspA family protein
MSYKTILVHADSGFAAPGRIRYAARLARIMDAHLVGVAATGVSRFLPPEVLAAGLNPLAARCRSLREEAIQALERFDLLVREEGVLSYESRLLEDAVDGGLPLAARYCDVAVLAQPDRTLVDPLLPPDLPQRLLLNSGHPVLLLPNTGTQPGLDSEALVAWDGSAGATRAVADALPLLRLARRVTLTGIGDQLPPTATGCEPCAALRNWLSRHGVAARASHFRHDRDIGAALLAQATDMGAGMIVMGAYGHSRLREALADGVTETVMRWTSTALFMAN